MSTGNRGHGCSKYTEASLSLVMAFFSVVAGVISVQSFHDVSKARSEFDKLLTEDKWYKLALAADRTAIIAAPYSVLVCVIYAIVRHLENTQLTENMPDTLVRLTSLLVGGATVAAFGVAGGLGSAAIANKLIHFELTTVVASFVAFVIGAILKCCELVALVRKRIRRSHDTPFL